MGNELAQDHVVAAEVGEEQQPQRTLPFLLAQGIRGEKHARRAGKQEPEPFQDEELGLPGSEERPETKRLRQLQPAKEENNQRRRSDARQVGRPASRRHPQFPVNYRQEGHERNAENRMPKESPKPNNS